MPGTPEELVTLAATWPDESLIPPLYHRWADGTDISDAEGLDVLALRIYVRRRRDLAARKPAQRKARRLLRSLLAPRQRSELRRLSYFYVTTPGGTTYRLDPRRGYAERVERHGRKWFVKRAYCLHDEPDEGKLPPADVTIAHLLLILADEPTFLATANESRRDDQLWNGAYLRRMRRRHLAPAPELTEAHS